MRAVLISRFISLTGTNMTIVALPWFVLATTGSTVKMGLVLACQTLPAFALGIPGGSVVAALGSRRALILGDAVRAPLLAAVPVLHALGDLSFPVLLVLVTAIGVFSVPYAAASSSLLPEIALIPLIGAPRLLYIDAASYAVSAFVVFAFVRVGRAVVAANRRRGALAGVRHVFSDSLLGSIVTVGLVAHVGLAALFASLPAFAFRELHDARAAGLLFTSDAVGSVLGGLLAMRLARHVKPLRLGIAGFALMSAPLWLLTLGTPLALVVAVMFLFGIGGPLGVSPISAIMTMRAPAEIRPQVVAAFLSITSAGTPVGAAVTGYVIERAGFRFTYGLVAAAMTLSTLLLVWCVRRVSAIPAAAPVPTPS